MNFLGPKRELSLQVTLSPQSLKQKTNSEAQLRSAYLQQKLLESLIGSCFYIIIWANLWRLSVDQLGGHGLRGPHNFLDFTSRNPTISHDEKKRKIFCGYDRGRKQ